MSTDTLASKIETVLFLSGDSVSAAYLAELFETDEGNIGKAIDRLDARYHESVSGLSLVGKDGEIKLVTRPENASVSERYRMSEREGPLSRASLETLSIIAYRGPVSRADVDAIRGVNSTMTIRNLLLRGLIEREGNPDDARGYLYVVAFQFLETLGISDISELPEYQSLSRDPRLEVVEEIENKNRKTEDDKGLEMKNQESETREG